MKYGGKKLRFEMHPDLSDVSLNVMHQYNKKNTVSYTKMSNTE